MRDAPGWLSTYLLEFYSNRFWDLLFKKDCLKFVNLIEPFDDNILIKIVVFFVVFKVYVLLLKCYVFQ